MVAITATIGVLVVSSAKEFLLEAVEEQIFGPKVDEYKNGIDALKRGQEEIIKRLNRIESRQIVMEVNVTGAASYDRINEALKKLEAIATLENISKDERRRVAEEHVKSTLQIAPHGIEYHLDIINSMVCGDSSMPGTLLDKFLDHNRLNSNHDQTEYYRAFAFCQDINLFQVMGYIVLANSQQYSKGKGGDISWVLEKLKLAIDKQTTVNKAILDRTNKWYQNNDFRQEYFTFDVGLLGGANRYVDMHPNEAPEGEVVTGIQFYQKHNRLALSIRTKPIGSLDPQATEPPAGTWRKEDAFGQTENTHYLDVSKFNYAHLEEIILPPGYAVTGAQFTAIGNRVAIKLQAAQVAEKVSKEYRTNYSLVPETKKWFDPKDFSKDFYEIKGEDVYANLPAAAPAPESFLSGAALIKFHNRLSIKLMTAFDQL